MDKKELEGFFKELEGAFDIENPQEGHRERFLQKLQTGRKTANMDHKKNGWWKPLSIAASIVFLLSLGLSLYNSFPTREEKIAKISPEASKTEFYFANLVNEQVKELKKESTPETEKIITDTMVQLKILETDYQKMEKDLLKGGNSKLILSAMIVNFQTRMDLLQDVLDQIETIKSIKNKSDEMSMT